MALLDIQLIRSAQRAENRPTTQIVLRLDPGHLRALDEKLLELPGVTRSAWIRGAILQRLGVLQRDIPTVSDSSDGISP